MPFTALRPGLQEMESPVKSSAAETTKEAKRRRMSAGINVVSLGTGEEETNWELNLPEYPEQQKKGLSRHFWPEMGRKNITCSECSSS